MQHATFIEEKVNKDKTFYEEKSQNEYNNTFHEDKDKLLIEKLALLVKNKKPKDATQFLSLFCAARMSCEEAKTLIGRKIYSRKWANANRHALFPGVGEPPQKSFWQVHRRMVSDEKLIQFMQWLKPEGLIQNLSFGQKLACYHNGLYVPIESVKRTDSIRNIVCKYYHRFLGDNDFLNDESDIEEDNENVSELEKDCDENKKRCASKCKKTMRRCYLPLNYTGRH